MPDEPDTKQPAEPQVSEKTRKEQEAGKRIAAENAKALDLAMAARAAEEAPPEEEKKADDEGMAAATAEAEKAAESKGFPHAKEPYQPNQPNQRKSK